MTIQVADDLPAAIRDSCEPFRGLPRAPAGTWSHKKPLDDAARWNELRKKRAMHAVKWPKVTGVDPAHVKELVARLESAEPPRTLLAPEVEATWLWLETEKSANPSSHGELIVDQWASVDVSAALTNLITFAKRPDRGSASMEEPRRLRAHLSVAGEGAWNAAHDLATKLREGEKGELAALLAYLFPEDTELSNKMGAKLKKVFGYEHLLALSITDPETLADVVKKGKNAWGHMLIHGVIPAWAIVTMGPKAKPVIDAIGKHWPDNVAAEREWLKAHRA